MGRFNEVFLYSITSSGIYNSGFLQHLPTSAQHAQYSSFAKSRETGSILKEEPSRQQALHYFIPPKGLDKVWNLMKVKLIEMQYFDISNPILLLSSKNLKTQYCCDNGQELLDKFNEMWVRCLNTEYLKATNCWIDIGKETIHSAYLPKKMNFGKIPDDEEESDVEDLDNIPVPYTYLWNRKCLQNIKKAFDMDVPKSGMKVQFFPLALLHDSCDMTLEPGKRHPLYYVGLVYSQFYSSTKEIFDCAKTYLFDDISIEGLAIDSSLLEEWKAIQSSK